MFLFSGIVGTTDVKEAFTDIDFAILVGAFPRKDGMERKDLLQKNCAIFKEQGEALNQFAKKSVKVFILFYFSLSFILWMLTPCWSQVVVVGNPANTNAALAMRSAPSIPRENFSALTRLDHNRAKVQRMLLSFFVIFLVLSSSSYFSLTIFFFKFVVSAVPFFAIPSPMW